MFPASCPPTTIVSMNARFDPHYHMRIGEALRPLRKEKYLLLGSGGAVHNLYRNKWAPMIQYRDNFAQETPPGDWALEFRQAVQDVISKNDGPRLRRAMTRLMKHPQYRDAHATDDHFMSAMFVAGAAGDVEDEGVCGVLKAEDWELVSLLLQVLPLRSVILPHLRGIVLGGWMLTRWLTGRQTCATRSIHLARGCLHLYDFHHSFYSTAKPRWKVLLCNSTESLYTDKLLPNLFKTWSIL